MDYFVLLRKFRAIHVGEIILLKADEEKVFRYMRFIRSQQSATAT